MPKERKENAVAMSAEGVRGRIANREKTSNDRVKNFAIGEINDRLSKWGTSEGEKYAKGSFACYPRLQDLSEAEVMPISHSRMYLGVVGGRPRATLHQQAIVNSIVTDFQGKGWDIEEFYCKSSTPGGFPTLLLFRMRDDT